MRAHRNVFLLALLLAIVLAVATHCWPALCLLGLSVMMLAALLWPDRVRRDRP